MLELKFISPTGTEIDLANNSAFYLTGVDGLTLTKAAISATDLATFDGTSVNNVKTQPRGIVLYLRIANTANVEAVKRYILQTVKPKQTGVLRWTQNERTLDISGVVEAIEMPRFKAGVVMQISLYCPQPYWEDAAYIVQQLALVIPLHYFGVAFPQNSGIVMGEIDLDLTQAFDNTGDAETGAIITIIATGNITNPLLTRNDGLYFGIIDTMEAHDEIIISTIKGKKTVTKNGVNIIGKVKSGSTWLQLDAGENIFTISEAGGTTNMYFNIEYKRKFV